MTGITEPGLPLPIKEGISIRREGRYSLSRLFFNFYLVAMGSFVAIAFFADLIISAAQRGVTDDYARRFMRGTIILIEDDLARHPQSTWQKRIKVLDEKFAYNLDIVDRHPLSLPPSQEQKLNNGEIALVRNGEIMYHQIRGTNRVLVIGPLAPANKPDVVERRMPIEFRLQLLTWSLIGVIFAVALWFWIRPVWRDLESLRQTARALGDGDFGARSPDARTKLFAPLSLTLNGMAERIQQLIAAHRDLSCGVSHELRTPIARLRFGLEMLSETNERAERARLWAMMEQDLDELDGLIDVSLTYARFERERPAPQFSATPLAEWVSAEIESIRMLGRDLDIQLDTEALPPECEVRLDRKTMPYALKNLVRNAIKYAQSRIVIRASLDGDQVIITVDDDGIGIPEEHRERIFSAFTRLDRSRDRATGGYGLGLAIVRRVLDLHHGTATADASPLGGARFILSWPMRPR